MCITIIYHSKFCFNITHGGKALKKKQFDITDMIRAQKGIQAYKAQHSRETALLFVQNYILYAIDNIMVKQFFLYFCPYQKGRLIWPVLNLPQVCLLKCMMLNFYYGRLIFIPGQAAQVCLLKGM